MGSKWGFGANYPQPGEPRKLPKSPLDKYVSNPDPIEDKPTDGLTPTCELRFAPKGFHFFCRGNCGANNCQYQARMGSYTIYLCAECLLVKFLDLMVVDPLEAVSSGAGKSG